MRGGTALRPAIAAHCPDALATVTSLLQVAAILVAVLYLREPRSPERLVLASTAAVAGFLAFNRFIRRNTSSG